MATRPTRRRTRKSRESTSGNTRWKESLVKYEAPSMDVAKDEALKDFMDRKKASMEDAWY